MKTHEFIEMLEDDAIASAIGEAESVTSAEIRVFISRKNIKDPMAEAHKQFARLGMDKTEMRTGMLIFVAPVAQVFCVAGDRGIHEHVGEDFWRELASEMEDSFKKEEFTEGIIRVILHAKDLLKECLPRQADDQNELPNKVERD